VLITGGPESFEFAKRFSPLPVIRINPLCRDLRAGVVPKVQGESFKTLLPGRVRRTPKRIGVANWNIFPQILFADLNRRARRSLCRPTICCCGCR